MTKQLRMPKLPRRMLKRTRCPAKPCNFDMSSRKPFSGMGLLPRIKAKSGDWQILQLLHKMAIKIQTMTIPKHLRMKKGNIWKVISLHIVFWSYHQPGPQSFQHIEYYSIYYPIVSKKADDDEAEPLDNSLYKYDGSLEIDFSSLVDVHIIKDRGSGPEKIDASSVSEGPLENKNASEPGSSTCISTQTVISSSETGSINQIENTVPAEGLNVWDQITEALDAKKEELSQETGWGKNPKKLQLVGRRTTSVKNAKKVQSTQGNRLRKNASRVHPSVENSPEKQSPARKSWSYKALRGSALGPAMDILRSRKEI